MEIHAVSNPDQLCPYCRDALGREGVVRCSQCQTVMHRDCFLENGGCVTMGCERQKLTSKRCPECNSPVTRASAIVCPHCNCDLRRYPGFENQNLPAIHWRLPDWMVLLKNSERLKQTQQFTLRLVLGVLFMTALPAVQYFASHPVVDIIVLLGIPVWGFILYMLLVKKD